MKRTVKAVRTPASSTVLKAVVLTGAGLWAGAPCPALANPADLFGLGAREASMGNAFTAVADDPFAAYYNMGGLSQLKRTTLAVSIQAGHMMLGDPSLCPEVDGVGCSEPFYFTTGGANTIQQKRYGYDEPHGVAVGLAVPLHRKLNVGLAAYIPLDVRYDEEGNFDGIGSRLTRLMTIDPYVPDYVMYQNRPQRFAAYAGLSFEIIPGLGVGVGASVLASATMNMDIGATVVAEEGPAGEDGNPTTEVSTQMNTRVTMDLRPKAVPVAGIFWNLGSVSPKLQAWQMGLSWRAGTKLPAQAIIDADVAVSAQLDDNEEPLSYGMTISGITMDITEFSTPQQAAFGISGLIADRVRIAADVTWQNWRTFEPSVAQVPEDVLVALGLSLGLANARQIEKEGYKDIFVPRLGIEGRLGPFASGSRLKGLDLYLRAGGGYVQNPLGEMTGTNNLLNSDRIEAGAGLGITTHNPFSTSRDLPVSLDFSAQYHHLLPTTHEKVDMSDNPPDGYPVDGVYVSKGSVVQGALTLQLGF